MKQTYQFWQHMKSREIYAVRLEQGALTGICGPLHPNEVRPENLPAFDYNDQRDDVAWAQEHDQEPGVWRIFEP
jgi:hypothetical protein